MDSAATNTAGVAVQPALAGPSARAGGSKRVGALRAHRILARVGLQLAPALAAAATVYLHGSRLGLSLLLGAAVLAFTGALESRRYPVHLMPLGGLAIRAAAPLAAAALTLLVALAFDPISVSAVGPSVFAAWFVLAAVTILMQRVQRGMEIRLAVVGSAELATSLESELELAGLGGYHVVGWVDVTGRPPVSGRGMRSLGPAQRMREIIVSEHIDLIVYGVRESRAEEVEGISSLEILERVSEACLGLEVRLIGANQLYEELFGHVPLATVNAAWFQYVLHPRFRAASPLSKRAFDLGLGAVALLLTAPLLALAAIAIKLSDRGPVLYRQRRVGESGHEFEILKLRTMRVNAEREGSPEWSSTDDKRVTPVGRLLRRTHVDELPQLWNVLRGEMSLLGPRPERPEFVGVLEQQLPYYDRRQLMKPGITGWAQVRCGYSGSDTGTAWKLCHDLYYFKHRSLGLDLLVLLETIITPLRDSRMTVRVPDEMFVLGPVRD
jgi:exopolysaccharide biosynthesis polyprenyl glycosylphosphotransferase